ncbi:MAG: helix-turn-helix domain-containing protein [Bacilli bacterium]|nr:helix-turn-helix domain-containing protein [Bacilli bacterium]
MDQIKIGKFISQKRKEKNITQRKLAEQLGITDRAVSKWENGLCLPDASNMNQLCEILGITINDLYSGQIVNMNQKETKLEENLLEMAKLKEQADKKMLNLEIVIGYISSTTFLVLVFVASFIKMPTWLSVLLIIFGLTTFFIGMHSALKIEQTAGYYKCAKCNHKYVPTYASVSLAMHINRTRYMKCPKCGKRSWNKKVITK